MQSSSDVNMNISKIIPLSKLASQNPELPNQENLALLIQFNKKLKSAKIRRVPRLTDLCFCDSGVNSDQT